MAQSKVPNTLPPLIPGTLQRAFLCSVRIIRELLETQVQKVEGAPRRFQTFAMCNRGAKQGGMVCSKKLVRSSCVVCCESLLRFFH